ncbi:MAG: thiamine-phosphate kinase [Halieaceae bacterium]
MALGEFDLIERYFAQVRASPSVQLGVGDDAAVLALPAGHVHLISTDTAVSGVHFLPDSAPYVIASASDLAAMGAKPEAMLLALTLPEANADWLASFAEGVRGASEHAALPLIGGDTTRGPLSVTVTVLGSAPSGQYLTRSGAQPGDRLCVSGTLGDAAAGFFLLGIDDTFVSAADLGFLRQRFLRPTPQLTLGQTLNGLATSAIDVSDGLLADAGHLARLSSVGLIVDPGAIPISAALRAYPDPAQVQEWALRGGDDYELLFTLPSHAKLPDGCTEIGQVISGNGVRCDGVTNITGYDHFER